MNVDPFIKVLVRRRSTEIQTLIQIRETLIKAVHLTQTLGMDRVHIKEGDIKAVRLISLIREAVFLMETSTKEEGLLKWVAVQIMTMGDRVHTEEVVVVVTRHIRGETCLEGIISSLRALEGVYVFFRHIVRMHV